MKDKIKVIVIKAGKIPELREVNNTLETFQKLVGGYIETATVSDNCVVICDEEGRIKGKRFNMAINRVGFFGTIVLAGVDGEDFGDCPIDYERFCGEVFGKTFLGVM